MEPTSHIATISTIDLLIKSFDLYSIVEVNGNKCAFIGEIPSLGDKCVYIGEGALISEHTLHVALIAGGSRTAAYEEDDADGSIRKRLFLENGRLKEHPSFNGLYVRNLGKRKKGVAFTLDVIRFLERASKYEHAGNDLSRLLEISTLPPGPFEEGAFLDPRDVGLALEASDLQKLNELFDSDKKEKHFLRGDGHLMHRLLEFHNCNNDKLKPCIDYLISKQYFHSRDIGSALIQSGWEARKTFLVELGISYGGDYETDLRKLIRAGDELRTKRLIDLAIKHGHQPAWPTLMQIAEVRRKKSMLDLLLGYGAVRTPWSPSMGYIDSYSITDEWLREMRSEYGPSSWVDRSRDDEWE